MNDNTILRIKVPAHLYESVKKQLTLTEAKKGGKTYGDWTVVKEKKMKTPKDGMKKIEEEQVDEAAPGVEYAWIPAAAAGLGIAASVIKSIVGYMKDNNLKGMQGFLRAYKEVGKDASSTIDKKMGGNMEEAKEEEKIEEIDNTSINEADDKKASVEEIFVAIDKAVKIIKTLVKQGADKKGGSLTQDDLDIILDDFKYSVHDYTPFAKRFGIYKPQ
jgi:hypothetical protein